MDLSDALADVLDPQLWRQRFAAGLNLGAMSDSTIAYHLRAAASELGLRLGLKLKIERLVSEPVDATARKGVDYDRIVPRLPWNQEQHASYYRIDLGEPVLSVQRIRCYQLNQQIIAFDSSNSDIVLEHPQHGIVHLIPRSLPFVTMISGHIDQFFLNVPPFISTVKGPLPNFWAVDYTTGPISILDTEPGRIDARLASWVGAKAATVLLPLAGNALTGGVVSHTAAMDGVSRTVNMGPNGVFAQAAQAFKDLDDGINWNELRAAARPMIVW
jgi:hypothetical protein